MPNAIIVPVRAGSKGLKHKNIRLFCGTPLLGYVLNKLSSSDKFDYVIVSSDSDDYLALALEYGATDIIKRPALLASDTAASTEVVKHAITEFERSRNLSIERYFMTQVTSPLWLSSELTKFVDKSNAIESSMVSVCHTKQNPYYNLLKKTTTGYSLIKKSNFKRRQDHADVYFINGCFYSFKSNTLFSDGVIREPSCEIFLMNSLRSIDIDSLEDFKLCELLAQKMGLFCDT